ncbi:O-fucosyltransferase 39 [Glycine soja]
MVGSHTTVLDRDGGLRKWGLLSSNFDPSSSSSSTLAVLVIHYSSYSHSFSWGKRGHFSDPKMRSSTHHDEARPTSQLSELWSPLESQGWKPYVESNKPTALLEKLEGYIQVFLDGGLNQQKLGICDAVVVAKILNATPVIPYLELDPVWRDSSSFMDIFDVDHFIDVLKNDISIVKELPKELLMFDCSSFMYYGLAIRETKIKAAPVHA